MTWNSTWRDILNGGPTRWKVDDLAIKRQALTHILHHHAATTTTTATTTATATTTQDIEPLHIFCPLAGDDPFVALAWKEGHSVTSIDMVPEAVALMRQQFSDMNEDTKNIDEDWEMVSQVNPPTKIWKHKSGRATLYEGDVLEHRPELDNQFDAVYDKDSFGALDVDMRSAFCTRVSSYLKPDGILYTEVKFKLPDNPERAFGPPFHLEKEDLMQPSNFGSNFEYMASLGELYKIKNMPNIQQHGHILRRLARPIL